MIHIRPCGHSEETDSLRYRKHPGRCFYCDWLVKHPQDAASRLANRARLHDQAIKHGLGIQIRNRPLKSKAKPQ